MQCHRRERNLDGMTILESVLARVDRYLAKSGENPTNFGLAVADNPALVSRLRNSDPRMGTVQKVVDYLDEHDPEKKVKNAC